MSGALVRCHDPRRVHHRRAEALEPPGGTTVTGHAGQEPDARAAMPGQAEGVITSLSGLGTPRWRSASAWAWPAGAATPEEPPVSHLPDAFRAAAASRNGPLRWSRWPQQPGQPPRDCTPDPAA